MDVDMVEDIPDGKKRTEFKPIVSGGIEQQVSLLSCFMPVARLPYMGRGGVKKIRASISVHNYPLFSRC
jgi:hypothetical protein